MSTVSLYVNWISIGFGFLAFYILSTHAHSPASTSRKLLRLFFLSASWGILVTTSNVTGFTLTFPHLSRTAIPISMVIPAASFLYVKSVVYRHYRFSPGEYWYFLPAFLGFLNLLPFYVRSADYKLKAYQSYLERDQMIESVQESIFASSWIFTVVTVAGLTYAIAQAILVYQAACRPESLAASRLNRPQLYWLIALTGFLLVTYLSNQWLVVSLRLHPDAYQWFGIIKGSAFLGLCLVLYRRPDLLYFLPEKKATPNRKKCALMSASQIADRKEELLTHLRQTHSYLDPNISLDILSQELDISRNNLSFVLNNGVGMKFNDLINQHRITYLRNNLENLDYENLTLEGLAHRVGFNSRTTFLHAVRKFTGVTPTEFIKQLEDRGKPDTSFPN